MGLEAAGRADLVTFPYRGTMQASETVSEDQPGSAASQTPESPLRWFSRCRAPSR